MRKEQFYQIQADAFRNYAGKFAGKDLLQLFMSWAQSKDICPFDKEQIWKIVRKFPLLEARGVEKKVSRPDQNSLSQGRQDVLAVRTSELAMWLCYLAGVCLGYSVFLSAYFFYRRDFINSAVTAVLAGVILACLVLLAGGDKK